MQWNIEKKCLVFKINAFELVAVNSSYYGENDWHMQSMGLQTVLKFDIWLRGTFAISFYIWMMKKWDESALLQTSAVFGTR